MIQCSDLLSLLFLPMTLSTSPEQTIETIHTPLIDATRTKCESLFAQIEANTPWNIHGSERSLGLCHKPITSTQVSDKGRLITEAIARHEAAMRLTRRLSIHTSGQNHTDRISQIMAAATVQQIERTETHTKVTVTIAPEVIQNFKDRWRN